MFTFCIDRVIFSFIYNYTIIVRLADLTLKLFPTPTFFCKINRYKFVRTIATNNQKKKKLVLQNDCFDFL